MNNSMLRLILPTAQPDTGCKNRMYRQSSDPDRAIILPIVILLMAENCDFFMIFALLYILM